MSEMKHGFTTGSCAAAAAKAAACMLFGGGRRETISIMTPAGIEYRAELEDISVSEDHVSCAVRKYSGDDPDVTAGTLIYAAVYACGGSGNAVEIEAGEGVGTVTRPGLDQPPGSPAINSVPRRMIEENVREAAEAFGYCGDIRVVVSVPGGRELALKTFNPRLGIEGGISIIGTSGIIEPMSTRAILETIRTELRQLKEEGHRTAVVSPGNYGLEFMKSSYGYDPDRAVKCSNFIGETIDMVCGLGYERLLLCGHVGKLIKLSGGIMNTHSAEADCRAELMAAAAARNGADSVLINRILDCVNTEEACELMKGAGMLKACFETVTEKAAYHLRKRAGDRTAAELMIYSSVYGLLGATSGAEGFLKDAMAEPLMPDKGEG